MGTLHTVQALVFLGLSLHCSRQTDPRERLMTLLGNWPAFDKEIRKVDDPMQRDLLLLQLAVASPRFSPDLCRKVESHGAVEKCRQVMGRPHLRLAR